MRYLPSHLELLVLQITCSSTELLTLAELTVIMSVVSTNIMQLKVNMSDENV